jgi:hypothetical protein
MIHRLYDKDAMSPSGLSCTRHSGAATDDIITNKWLYTIHRLYDKDATSPSDLKLMKTTYNNVSRQNIVLMIPKATSPSSTWPTLRHGGCCRCNSKISTALQDASLQRVLKYLFLRYSSHELVELAARLFTRGLPTAIYINTRLHESVGPAVHPMFGGCRRRFTYTNFRTRRNLRYSTQQSIAYT